MIEDAISEEMEQEEGQEIEDFDTHFADEAQEEIDYEMEHAEDSCILPTHMYIGFYSRKWDNKVLYILYKIFRIFLVSFWFYFVPFVAMFASYVIPFYMQSNQDQNG